MNSVQNIFYRDCVQVFKERLEVWSLEMVTFLSALSNVVITLPTWAEFHIGWKQEQILTAFWDLTPACLAKCYLFFLSRCVWVCIDTGDWKHEPWWQPAASAGRKKQNKTKKQEVSALWNKHTRAFPIFWLPVCRQQLHPSISFFGVFSFP